MRDRRTDGADRRGRCRGRGDRCVRGDDRPRRELYPQLRFEVARGEDFAVEEPVDAVFSSAALHWMSPPEAVAASVARALKPGGRFVAEMGGRGNIATIVAAIYQALAEEGIPRERVRNPWYFPSIGEYASLLERAGFEV